MCVMCVSASMAQCVCLVRRQILDVSLPFHTAEDRLLAWELGAPFLSPPPASLWETTDRQMTSCGLYGFKLSSACLHSSTLSTEPTP